jgi:hypothetical protein
MQEWTGGYEQPGQKAQEMGTMLRDQEEQRDAQENQ